MKQQQIIYKYGKLEEKNSVVLILRTELTEKCYSEKNKKIFEVLLIELMLKYKEMAKKHKGHIVMNTKVPVKVKNVNKRTIAITAKYKFKNIDGFCDFLVESNLTQYE